MGDCVCPYHSLKNDLELTYQMKNLGVKLNGPNAGCTLGFSQGCQHSSGNGVKRNFSNIEDEDKLMYSKHDYSTQERKVSFDQQVLLMLDSMYTQKNSGFYYFKDE